MIETHSTVADMRMTLDGGEGSADEFVPMVGALT
jgi:hypothetical protein